MAEKKISSSTSSSEDDLIKQMDKMQQPEPLPNRPQNPPKNSNWTLLRAKALLTPTKVKIPPPPPPSLPRRKLFTSDSTCQDPKPPDPTSRDAHSSSSSDSTSIPDVSKCPTTDAATQTCSEKAAMTSVATATDETLPLHLPDLPQATNDPSDASWSQSDTSQELNNAITNNNWSLASVLMHLRRCEDNLHLLCTLALVVSQLKQNDPRLDQLIADSKTALASLQSQATNIRKKCSRKILKRPSFEHLSCEVIENQRIADVKAITGEFHGRPSEDFKSIWITLYHIGSTDNFRNFLFFATKSFALN